MPIEDRIGEEGEGFGYLLSFANAELLRDLILEKSLDEDVRAVVIDASSINDLDTTAAGVLEETAETLAARGVELYLGGVKSPVMDVLRRSGLHERLGADHFFLSPHRAVKHILGRWGRAASYLEQVPGEDDRAT